VTTALTRSEHPPLTVPPMALAASAPQVPNRPLTRREKAAIIARLLLTDGTGPALSALDEDTQIALARQMMAMRHIDRETLLAVIGEFLVELDGIELSFPKGLDTALAVLDGHMSAATLARLRKERELGDTADPWARISARPVAKLAAALAGESAEVGAILLSKLSAAKAAELLSSIGAETAKRIARAMPHTTGTPPDTVAHIGVTLITELEDIPPRAFDEPAANRIGAILNLAPATMRDDLLADLETADTTFASAVRQAIFTFADIPRRVMTRDIPRVTREIDHDRLITALAAEAGPVAEYILANMSQRLAGQLREDMAELGKIRQKDGEAAMTAVVAAIRAAESAGEIKLVVEESDDE